MYIFHMDEIIISEKRAHEFEEKIQKYMAGLYMEEKERRNIIIIFSKKKTISALFILQIICLNIVKFQHLLIKSFVI